MKRLAVVLIWLLALPVFAQEDAVSKFIVPANQARDGYVFQATLNRGLYINYSNWHLVAEASSTPNCFQPRHGGLGAMVYNEDGSRGTAPGVEPMGIFRAEAACAFTFSLIDVFDDNPRGSGQVDIRKLKRVKQITLTNEWQKMNFGRGKFRYLGGNNGYQVDTSKPGHKLCMGDSQTSVPFGAGARVEPDVLTMTRSVTCWFRTFGAERTVGFAKW